MSIWIWGEVFESEYVGLLNSISVTLKFLWLKLLQEEGN